MLIFDGIEMSAVRDQETDHFGSMVLSIHSSVEQISFVDVSTRLEKSLYQGQGSLPNSDSYRSFCCVREGIGISSSLKRRLEQALVVTCKARTVNEW